MIKRLYIDNYKCLVNFELPLQEITLLIGPNGAGKTSILDVMYALRQLLSGVAKITDAGIFPTQTLTRWQKRDVQVFELDADLEGDALRYRLEVGHDRSTRRARIHLEQLTANGRPLFQCKDGEVQLYSDDHSEGPRFSVEASESAIARIPPRPENTRLTRFLDSMRKVTVCSLYPASFQTECHTEVTTLARLGQDFVAWYRHLLLERTDLVGGLVAALREAIDGFSNLRMQKTSLVTYALMIVFEQYGERYELRLDEISDGQRALIALYSLVRLAAGQGYTLFLDEPDNYLALPEIQPWLIELADACGDSVPQAVLCSHHPELIDYLGGDRGLELARETSGVTTVRPLSETPNESGLKLSELVARGWQR